MKTNDNGDNFFVELKKNLIFIVELLVNVI